MTASPTQISPTESLETLPQWRPATWYEYLAYRDEDTPLRRRLFFDDGYLLVHDMTGEGINHASFADLFTMIFAFWFMQNPEQIFSSFGRCLLEKEPLRAGAPDLVLYLRDDYPRCQEGEPRRINLHQWRVPDLVGEIGDTTLATDLDEKKKLYAAMGIPEYWVINVRGRQVFAFQLQADGLYQQIDRSHVLKGLPISLLEQTLALLENGTNGSAAMWFSQQLANLKLD
ncbi:MAG: Uma2 family endonuclease [Verrucomicrobia bacterium]|nr:Uma2 family endonuclease [Leptolyngbya sp. ES-bin-22]